MPKLPSLLQLSEKEITEIKELSIPLTRTILKAIIKNEILFAKNTKTNYAYKKYVEEKTKTLTKLLDKYNL